MWPVLAMLVDGEVRRFVEMGVQLVSVVEDSVMYECPGLPARSSRGTPLIHCKERRAGSASRVNVSITSLKMLMNCDVKFVSVTTNRTAP